VVNLKLIAKENLNLFYAKIKRYLYLKKTIYNDTIMKLLYFILLLLPFNLSASTEEYRMVISDHKFIPDELIVPAGKKIKLLIYNSDDEAEEFESFDLKREKIIPSKSNITVNISPLEPGEYKFFGEFHIKTAQGIIIAKDIE
jgi:hypothetical protein